jgi:O-antigen ligase
LLLTYSRGGFFALVAAMLFITIVCKERKAFYYIGIMLLLYYSFHFLQSTYRSDMSKLMIDSSSIYRLEIWRSSWELFKSNTLLGAGPGSVEKLLSYSSNSLKGIIMHAHNIPLQLLAETGILGLTAIVIFIFSELKRSLPICQKYRDIEHSYIAVGFGAALTGILAHGLVDCAVFIPSRSLVFLVYFGLFPAIYRKNHDKLR